MTLRRQLLHRLRGAVIREMQLRRYGYAVPVGIVMEEMDLLWTTDCSGVFKNKSDLEN